MTQNIEERAKINTFRSVSAMIAIGIINIITLPLISKLGGSDKRGYLLVAVLYGAIFAACHIFCFAKTKKAVTIPEKKKIPIKLQIQTVLQNKPYLLALLGQFLFGVTLYGRNADALYYFKYVEAANPCLLLIPWQLLFRQLLVPDCFLLFSDGLETKADQLLYWRLEQVYVCCRCICSVL